MKNQNYRGWKIYRTSSGSNNRLRSIKAKNPLREARLETVVNGSDSASVTLIKKDIDLIENGNPLI